MNNYVQWVLSTFNGTSTPKGSYRAKTGDNDCNVNSSLYSLSTALCESIRYQAKSEQNVRQDLIPRVRHGEAALCTPIIMYNDTKDMNWRNAMKAHGILKPLQHTQNTVLHSHTSSSILFKQSINCCSLSALLKDKFNLFHIRPPSYFKIYNPYVVELHLCCTRVLQFVVWHPSLCFFSMSDKHWGS